MFTRTETNDRRAKAETARSEDVEQDEGDAVSDAKMKVERGQRKMENDQEDEESRQRKYVRKLKQIVREKGAKGSQKKR